MIVGASILCILFLNLSITFYILVCVDYVTKKVDAIAYVDNDAHNVINFLKKNVFPSSMYPES